MNHYIVTGGAGFIGSHIASRVVAEGHRVTVLDNLSTGYESNIPTGADFIRMDVGDEKSYERLKNLSCDGVFHLAAQSSGEASFSDPRGDFNSHALGTFNLLEWCRNRGGKRFLYASSMSVYGDPQVLPVSEDHRYHPKTYYAAGKISAEAYVKLHQTLGLNTTVFRMFSVYGPGQNLANKAQGMVSIYLSYMLEGTPVVVKGVKERFRDLIYIDDVVEAWVMSLHQPKTYGQTYNLASGRKTNVEELLNKMRKAFGSEDYPIEFQTSTPGDQFGVVADVSRIQWDLCWSAKVDLETGLGKMIDGERKRKSIGQ